MSRRCRQSIYLFGSHIILFTLPVADVFIYFHHGNRSDEVALPPKSPSKTSNGHGNSGTLTSSPLPASAVSSGSVNSSGSSVSGNGMLKKSTSPSPRTMSGYKSSDTSSASTPTTAPSKPIVPHQFDDSSDEDEESGEESSGAESASPSASMAEGGDVKESKTMGGLGYIEKEIIVVEEKEDGESGRKKEKVVKEKEVKEKAEENGKEGKGKKEEEKEEEKKEEAGESEEGGEYMVYEDIVAKAESLDRTKLEVE